VIILKIGGSVITDKTAVERAKIDEMRRIAGELTL